MISLRTLAVGVVLGLAVLLVSGAAAAEERGTVAGARAKDRIHVKFVEGSAIRLRGNTLVSLSGADLSELHTVLRSVPGLRIQRLFSRSEEVLAREKAQNERRAGRTLPDKNLWYRMILAPGRDAGALAADLDALAIVQTAYPEPVAAPPPVTPSFVDDQGYLDPATDGIDAEYGWTIPGGTGTNIRVIDIEYSWNQNHEDLDSAVGALIANGTPDDPFDDTNHGTAVLGELIATNDSIGVTGVVHDAAVGLVNARNDEDGYDLADSIDLAAANSVAGDVILIEQQVEGANGGCSSTSQVGCVAVEWVEAYYDAIVNATAAGVVVVEAAGNGSQDLGDTGDYGDPFPDGRADSGAIIVGAGAAPGCTNPARGRLDFSSFGPRVNLQGWGQCVVTAGYNDLQAGPMNEWYTDSFGGTSSASPIVAGAAGVLSSVAQEQGVAWTPQQIRARLVATGTPQQFGLAGNIGPLPNLREALKAFVPDSNPGGPYTTVEGTNVMLNGTASSDPNGDALTYAWDFDGDGFDDGSTATVTYDRAGDDGVFTVRLRVTDSHGASDVDETTVTVSNVDPTATIDTTGTTLINGVPTFVANEGVPVAFSGRSTDPGSDDLTLTWSWGDGPPVPDVSTLYLNDPVNFPGGDPDPSPTTHPRDVTDNQSHAFSDACLYTVVFDALDDDGGDAADDSVSVVIGGPSGSTERGAGYWQTQYRPRPTSFSEARRQCYLEIVRFMSAVFSEARSLDTVEQAFDVLGINQNTGSALQKLDRELLAAWLNFANGAFGYDELVDTDGNGTPDTAFSTVMATAEAVRLNPASTEAQLLAQRDILQRINGS